MADRFPNYDVLAKRDTPSWNEATRKVVDGRLALTEPGDVLSPRQLLTLRHVCARIVPQPEGREPINTVAILLDKVGHDESDGFRPPDVPPIREAWTRGLDALEAEAQGRHGRAFATLSDEEADALLRDVERGEAANAAWGDMPAKQFWDWRLIPDIVSAYYAHPSAWSATGFGGPASPRGYVRLEANRRDEWEAAEEGDGALLPAATRNAHVA